MFGGAYKDSKHRSMTMCCGRFRSRVRNYVVGSLIASSLFVYLLIGRSLLPYNLDHIAGPASAYLPSRVESHLQTLDWKALNVSLDPMLGQDDHMSRATEERSDIGYHINFSSKWFVSDGDDVETGDIKNDDNSYAYVLFSYGHFIHPALVVARSLRWAGTKHDIVLLLTHHVTRRLNTEDTRILQVCDPDSNFFKKKLAFQP
jgi:hypothetical protein